MPWNQDHYRMDDEGFASQAEMDRAVNNGDLEELSNGSYWDRQTGDEYWSDGTKK